MQHFLKPLSAEICDRRSGEVSKNINRIRDNDVPFSNNYDSEEDWRKVVSCSCQDTELAWEILHLLAELHSAELTSNVCKYDRINRCVQAVRWPSFCSGNCRERKGLLWNKPQDWAQITFSSETLEEIGASLFEKISWLVWLSKARGVCVWRNHASWAKLMQSRRGPSRMMRRSV